MAVQTETLELTITGLPEGTIFALEEAGRKSGKSLEAYLRGLIEAELLSQKTFSEILAPIREEFRETRLTEEEFDEIIERERQTRWQEKQESRQ
ncbi:MAG: hypothetical protein SF339_25945 [Blastocatellia bacterium]|nr:hypothetical protein [Blastocatellia bacterium]